MKLTEQWHLCTGCRTRKTINFSPKEQVKKFKCECGKTVEVKNKMLK